MNEILILGFIFLFLVVVVPVLGATAHLVIKPLVDAIIRLREALSDGSRSIPTEPRLLKLEEELRALRREVGLLSEAEAFHRALSSSTNSREDSSVGSEPLPSSVSKPDRH